MSATREPAPPTATETAGTAGTAETTEGAETTVHNLKHITPAQWIRGDLRIGRPGPWGNRYIIGRDGDRDAVVRKHLLWLALPAQAPLRARARLELRGRRLWCFCAPARCHGDNLKLAADSADDTAFFEALGARAGLPRDPRAFIYWREREAGGLLSLKAWSHPEWAHLAALALLALHGVRTTVETTVDGKFALAITSLKGDGDGQQA